MSQTIYDVGGVQYPRPFRIHRLGHFGFNLGSLDKGLDFYGRQLGFRLTDETTLDRLLPGNGAGMEDGRLFFMTNNTDHHAFPPAHRSLGTTPTATSVERPKVAATSSATTWNRWAGTDSRVHKHGAAASRTHGPSHSRIVIPTSNHA